MRSRPNGVARQMFRSSWDDGDQGDVVLGKDSMLDQVVALLRERMGEGWAASEAPDSEFVELMTAVLRASENVHLIDQPEPGETGTTFRCWIDAPLDDLMGADQLAYSLFAFVSGEIFFCERTFDGEEIVYAFVTGSQDEGHVARLVFSGPNTKAFTERFRNRVAGGPRYHA